MGFVRYVTRFKGMEKSKKIWEGPNRLSELPDSIIDCILSYLPTADEVVRTKILSKRWGGVNYSLIRTVCLDEWKFEARKSSLSKGHDDGTTFESYFDGFMKSLRENKVRIKKFELRLISNSGKDKYHIVDRWTKAAIDSSVEEISLLCGSGKNSLSFPTSAFEAKSLKALRLELNIKFPNGLCGIPVSLICLERLDLSAVQVSEELLHYIISHCPKLEELLLSYVKGVGESQLTINHHNVKYINIRQRMNDWKAYDVEAPRLERLALWIPQFGPFRLTATRNLRFLDITSRFTPALEAFLCDVIPNLPMLETLHLHSRSLKKLKVRSCSMQVINWTFDATPESVEIDAPNLRRLYLSSVNWDPIRCLWLGNLGETFSKLPMCQILYIKCSLYTERKEFGLEDFEDPNLRSRIPKQPEHLMLDVDASCPTSFSAIVTHMLWHWRPKFLYYGGTTIRPKHLQFFLEALKATNCCSGNSFKCWRHYLKDVHEISSRKIEAAEPCCYDPYYAQSFKAHEAICLKLDW